MKKSKRMTLAKETVEITRQGWYVASSGKKVSIAREVERARNGTFIYNEGKLPAGEALCSSADPARIEVTNESTFAALTRLRAEGGTRLGCLNFASAKNPGGGFLNGAEAQEEALSRASALHECLLEGWDSYERNRACGTCLYLDLMIVSPDVPFFRDDGGDLLDGPLLATVITAPAPNAGAVSRNEPDRVSDIEPTLKRRAKRVVHAAALQGISELVLGAWGCGVFRNDPAMVARVFADLVAPGCAYSTAFSRVVFAIYDPSGTGPNFTAFQEALA
jgi:uncharacterized protein (TIGR02452 family)